MHFHIGYDAHTEVKTDLKQSTMAVAFVQGRIMFRIAYETRISHVERRTVSAPAVSKNTTDDHICGTQRCEHITPVYWAPFTGCRYGYAFNTNWPCAWVYRSLRGLTPPHVIENCADDYCRMMLISLFGQHQSCAEQNSEMFFVITLATLPAHAYWTVCRQPGVNLTSFL